ncbi:FxSxx-COOH system tetratricopeptide repeat protein [Frankia sp. Ag45/Mut15]|uniref:FxSxx-COOH system tetratricopeptide repeat protein n=1 Tax=Frankia umida TaxID=573489 RepID=A0ABT0K4Y0_9ACTN|nr:FxSxx-COOH system tetratricopeptide repeat protein [Frankia umida]MCK9878852.1 FxSxx-COOH system tetratricopeptide repeat protein [Frankia umida]
MLGDRDSTPGWDFFISYTASDQKWAEWTAWQLESVGYQVLIQAWDFVPGSDWRLKMEHGIKHATRTIAVLSRGYLTSVYGGEEWRAARAADPEGLKRKLLPIRIEECERPGVLDTVVSIDLFGLSAPDASVRLLDAVRGAIQGRRKPVVEPEFPIRPGHQQRPPSIASAGLASHVSGSGRKSEAMGDVETDRAANVEMKDFKSFDEFEGDFGDNVNASEIARMRPIVWGGVPRRNKYFSGREDPLAGLYRALIEVDQGTSVNSPYALQGMCGVGKTQIAIEYVFRHQDEYELIWWVTAEEPIMIRSALAALALRLGLAEGGPLRTEDAVALVVDALRRGDPYRRWLLVFDNAVSPELVLPFIPHGPGHVIVTTRDRSWLDTAHGTEVDVFSRQESFRFLRKRARGIGEAEIDSLAETLGHLPLALEQASALHFEMGITALEYLRLFHGTFGRLLSEGQPSDYPMSVASILNLSMARLQEQSPFALRLLRRCAYFGPEPISLELLDRGRYILDSDFGIAMRDRLAVGRAIRDIGRYALARIDESARTLQVHRLVQIAIRNELPEEDQERIRGEVHQLLIAADPGEPDAPANWPQFSQLLPHIVPSEVYRSRQPPGRRLIEEIVRYLYYTGDLTFGLAEANRALECWIADSGEDDPDVLVMQGIKANILWTLGRYQEAYDLRRPTLEAITRVLGPDHEETLIILNGHGADLRARGEFTEAWRLDEDSLPQTRRVFGDDAQQTMRVANNLAVDYGLIGSYARALETDERNLAERRALAGKDDDLWVLISMGAVARGMRQAGRYLEAQQLAEQTYLLYRELVQRGELPAYHNYVLQGTKDLSVARRKAGDFAGALELARDVYDRYTSAPGLGSEHPESLAAAISLGNAQRVAADPLEATEHIGKTIPRFRDVFGPDHPYTYGCLLDLALVYRQLDRTEEAEKLLGEALTGLQSRLGPDHHYTLTCVANLATVRAVLGHPAEALAMGQETLTAFRELLGPDHPHTLVCATNVALDLVTTGQNEESNALAEETMRRYRRVLGDTHPDVHASARGERVDLDFEPAPL